jgi:DNA excision repair protein ERCC-4
MANLELKPTQVVGLVDTRAQRPLTLEPLRVERASLPTGSYTVKGLEHVIAIECKSLFDLLACVGKQRERFEQSVQRMLAYPVRVLIIESTWDEIEAGRYNSKVKAEAVIGSLLGWIAAGLQVDLVGSHARASKHVARLLYTVAKRRYRELAALPQHQAASPELILRALASLQTHEGGRA